MAASNGFEECVYERPCVNGSRNGRSYIFLSTLLHGLYLNALHKRFCWGSLLHSNGIRNLKYFYGLESFLSLDIFLLLPADLFWLVVEAMVIPET